MGSSLAATIQMKYSEFTSTVRGSFVACLAFQVLVFLSSALCEGAIHFLGIGTAANQVTLWGFLVKVFRAQLLLMLCSALYQGAMNFFGIGREANQSNGDLGYPILQMTQTSEDPNLR
ncbi:unnamed protein product [Calypogeia fissa]